MQPVYRLRAWGRINLPEIANSFQHSLEEGRRRGEKAFSKARVPHLAPFPLFSSPACCSLSAPPRFLLVFLAPASQVSAVSISAYTPASLVLLSCSYLSKDRRDAMLPGRNSPWSCSALKVKFKPHHWIHRSFSLPSSSPAYTCPATTISSVSSRPVLSVFTRLIVFNLFVAFTWLLSWFFRLTAKHFSFFHYFAPLRHPFCVSIYKLFPSVQREFILSRSGPALLKLCVPLSLTLLHRLCAASHFFTPLVFNRVPHLPYLISLPPCYF